LNIANNYQKKQTKERQHKETTQTMVTTLKTLQTDTRYDPGDSSCHR
jgi:hypothetical protein